MNLGFNLIMEDKIRCNAKNVGITRITLVAPNSVNEGSRSSKKEQTDIAE